jgi:RNA polymerase sigma-70 factor (ECF subfamily)
MHQGDADPRTDEQLVQAANAGEQEAFEALYLRYRDWVVALAYRLTGSRDAALDIAQEVFLWLLRLFPGFELRAKMKTVLYPAVRNAAITGRRRESVIHSNRAEVVSISIVGAPGATNPGEAEARDRVAALREIFSALSSIHREVLILRFADDLSLEEIALAIGMPLGTVKSRLHHALGALRADPRARKLYFE